MMPASLRSFAGTIGVSMSMNGTKLSLLRLTPPPMTISEGLKYFSIRL